MDKTTTYKKQDLRLHLQEQMHQPVSAKEFARWFGYFCDIFNKSDDIRNAKELELDIVDELASWLGYPLY